MNFSSYTICQAIIGNRHNTRNLTIRVIVVVMAAGKAIMRMQKAEEYLVVISKLVVVSATRFRRAILWTCSAGGYIGEKYQ